MTRNRKAILYRPLTVLLLLSCLTTNGVLGYSRGAPDTTCNSMMPGHGLSTQSSPSPYTITPSTVSVEAGKRMLVTLQTPDGERGFMGFIVQARNPDSEEIVGTFFTTDHSYLTCGRGINNAVTHSSATAKAKVLLEWEAPSDYSGEVVFRATFVKTYDTFWVGVTSEKVTVTGPPGSQGDSASAGTPASPAAPAPAPAPTTTTESSPVPVSPNVVQTISPQNAGDLVINIVDAPGVDGDVPVVENDIGVVVSGNEVNSIPTPTLISSPSSNSSSSDSSPSLPPSTSLSTTASTSVSPSVITDSPSSSSSVSDSTNTENATPSKPAGGRGGGSGGGGGGGGGGRRRFGLLGRFKTTTTPAPKKTTPSEPEPEEEKRPVAPRIPNANLSPTEVGLQNTMQNIYLGCNANKGCYGHPSGCEDKETCDMLATYTKVSNGYQFEILGKADSNSYVALGLSDDQKMGSDSVMGCTLIDGVVDVIMSFNTETKSNEILTNSKYGLSNVKTAGIDGRVYCSFIREALTEVGNINFDLDEDRFHLMLAKGPASPNKLSYHTTRVVTSSTASLQKFEALASEFSTDLFRKLHAAFMIGAWVCAASCGILLARYYKQTWLNNKCCGIDQWFHFHRFFMFLTWALTIAGFVLIVLAEGIVDDPITENPHPLIGVISVGLCFIQPFMALCRCSPTHKNRPIFNWFHWFVGNSAQILGLTAIFFGFDLIGAPKWTWFIFVIFIAFHCVVHLILSIGQCVSDSKGDKSNNVFPLKEMNGSRTPLHPSDKKMDAPGGLFRKTMLALYLIVVWVITAILILVVVAGEETLRDWGLLFWEK